MNKKASNNRYFMIELIINSIFLILAAAVCLNLFAVGRVVSRESKNLSSASIEAQNVAETFKSVSGDKTKMIDVLKAEILPDSTDNTLVLYYDETWTRTSASKKSYEICVDIEEEAKSVSALISVMDEEKIIFEIEVLKNLSEFSNVSLIKERIINRGDIYGFLS